MKHGKENRSCADMNFSTMMRNPYSDSLEVRVLSATPLELVTMLYDGAVDAVRSARAHLAAGNIHGRSRSITKAVNILIELSRSLNREAGGELSERLAGLYHFMRKSLLDANFRQTDDGLAITEKLLVSLREAWSAVSAQPTVAGSAAEEPVTAAAFQWAVMGEASLPSRHWNA